MARHLQELFNGEPTLTRQKRLHSLAGGLRSDLRRAHPDWTFSRLDANDELTRLLNSESLINTPASADFRVEPSAAAAVKLHGATLLKPNAARGWAYVGYTKDHLSFGVREVRFSPMADNPARVSKFFLIDHANSLFLPANRSDFTRQHTIEVPYGERLLDNNLKRFYEVNNRFLDDLPKGRIPAGLEHSNALIVIGARLENGREAIAIFSLADLAQTGAVHGQVYTDLHTEVRVDWHQLLSQKNRAGPEHGLSGITVTKTGLRGALSESLAAQSEGRVYYYGDQLETVNAEVCRQFGRELILRSPNVASDIADAEHRIHQIAVRRFVEERLTIVDGLPRDRRAVESMGLMMGDPGDWLDFHAKVDRSLQGRPSQRITTQEQFFDELYNGENDVVILVAHSTGSQLYLNGKKTSMKELQALPPRAAQSARPRLAILISCDAGKPQSSSVLDRFLGTDLPSLAQTLRERNFFDKVIAPDHKIGANEALTVLWRALRGARTQKIFDGWNSWGVDWRRALEPIP